MLAVSESPRIYLDHAATSWPKPELVYAAMDHYQRHLGAPAGRGAYAEAMQVQSTIAKCREKLARLIGVKTPDHIVFTQNGTDALNLAIHGLVRPGDHVIASAAEHNSVLRPLHHLRETKQVEVTYLPVDSHGRIDPADLQKAIRKETRLVALVHASNVTGAIQPAKEIGKIAREAGVYFLLDAAQSLGVVPLDAEQIGFDLLAAPGHKGLLGPLGMGLLYVGARRRRKSFPCAKEERGAGAMKSSSRWNGRTGWNLAT